MRYIFIICILFIQLFGYNTAEATAPIQMHHVSQHENDGISAFSFHHDPAAKLVRTIQFHCTTFKIRDQRFPDGLLSINNLGSYDGEETGIHANVYPASIWLPLVRLLLFPKHYFW